MARKSDSNLDDMTLRQLKAYSDSNPAEGLRISKRCKEASYYSAKNYRADRSSKILDAIGFPKSIDFENI
jgi:hypothetical protein